MSDSGGQHTKHPAIVANRTLTFNNGSNYRFLITNEDSGESITLAINESLEVNSGNKIGLRVYYSDGSPRGVHSVITAAGHGFLSTEHVSGSLSNASGPTNFSVALLAASSGEELARTETLPSVVAYTGPINQNSTSGQVRVSLPRDVLDRDTAVELTLFEGFSRFGADTTHTFEMEYEPEEDEFVTVINSSTLSPANYSYFVSMTMDGFEVLQIKSRFSSKENITITSPKAGEPTDPDDGGGLEIVQETGFSSSSVDQHTKHPSISANEPLTLRHGDNYLFLITNEDTGESITLAVTESAEIPSGQIIGFAIYTPEGIPRQSPVISSHGLLSTEVVSGSLSNASGPTNFSITLVNASTGEELARTQTRPSMIAYEGVLHQNSTSGAVRLSIPRDGLTSNTAVEMTFYQVGNRFSGPTHSFQLEYDPASDEFRTVIDATGFENTNYSWQISMKMGGFEVLGILSRYTSNSNLTITAPPNESTLGAIAGDDNTVDFNDVLQAISAFNSGSTIGGHEIGFTDVLEAIRAFNTGEVVN